MNIEEIREYCLKKAGVTEGFPFDEVTLVFKVGGKMFLLADLERAGRINLKGRPEAILKRREHYPGAVFPAYHMNKKHWCTVLTDSEIPEVELRAWIDASYRLVRDSLPKKVRETLGHEGNAEEIT